MNGMTRAALAITIVLAMAAGPCLALTHTVVSGDCLWNISKKYYGTSQYWPELQRYNGISNANLIYNGTKVDIPNVEVMKAMLKATTTAAKKKIASDAKANGGQLKPATPKPPAPPTAPPSTTPGSITLPFEPKSTDNPHGSNYDALKGLDTDN